jgi:CubicO group peptidase (beta-lactamase class C family)
MAQVTPSPSSNVPPVELRINQYSASTVVKPGFNSDPRTLRDIVRSEAAKLNCEAVEFGIWIHDSKIVTMALGDSMTDVPALTTMHYRIGGIAETFMSTLLLVLVKQHRIDLDWTIGRWFPGLLAADQVTFRMLVANTAGYIDYVTVKDFVDLQESQPFRAFTDDELINYSVRGGTMNFPPGTSQHTPTPTMSSWVRPLNAPPENPLNSCTMRISLVRWA